MRKEEKSKEKKQKREKPKKVARVPNMKQAGKEKKRADKQAKPKQVKSVKKGKMQRLQTKLIAAFMIPTVLFIAAGLVTYVVTSTTMENKYTKTAVTSVATLGEYYSTLLENVELIASRLAVDVDINTFYSGGVKNGNLTVNNVRNAINSEAIADKYIAHIMIISPNEICYGERGKIKKDLFNAFLESSEGQLVAEQGERAECWLSAHPGLDEQTGYSEEDYAMSYVKAMTNSGNKIIGYVVIDVRRSFVEDIMMSASNSAKSQEVLVLPDGVQVQAKEDTVTFAEQGFFQNILEKEEDNDSAYVSVGGSKYLFSYHKFGDGMVVASLIPRSEIMSSVRLVMMVTLIAIFLCVVVSIATGTIMANNISKALYSVNGVLKKTSEGDLTGQVAVKRRDEFATLGSNLTETIKSMKNLIMKMTNVSQDVSGSAEAVNSNSQVLLQVTDQISHAVGDINIGIIQQAIDTQSCVEQMGELADKISQVHERTNRMNLLTVETKSAVENGKFRVKELETKVEDSTMCTREILEEIGSLNKASEDISSIVVTMNSIAEETNLLSLNASIEAARAGEAGRGFAVVSEEIRKLADQSTQAGTRIGEIIMEVQERVGSTMQTAIRADGIVEAQIEALENTISIFEEISGRVTEMEKAVVHILHSVERIEKAKVDTLSAIESISATAHETEAASTELGDGSTHLFDTANQLNDAVQMLRENAVDLDNSVRIFKV